jgi:hypothetical protein
VGIDHTYGGLLQMNISRPVTRMLLLSIALAIFLAGNATAQKPVQVGSTSTVRLLVTCGDLQREANRWWGSFVQVSINGRSADLGSLAGQQCRGVPPDTLLRLPITLNTPGVPSDPISRTGMRLAEALNEIFR